MQANSTRHPPENGHSRPSSRAPSFTRPSIRTSGNLPDHSAPFNSPQSPTNVPEALTIHKIRQPTGGIDGTVQGVLPSTHFLPVTDVPPRSASGPPLRKATSSHTIGTTARLHNASFKDLVAKFNSNEERDVQAARLGNNLLPSGASDSTEYLPKPPTSLSLDSTSPAFGHSDYRSSSTSMANAQNTYAEVDSLSLSPEISVTSHEGANGLPELERARTLEEHSSPAEKSRGHILSDLSHNVTQWFNTGNTSPQTTSNLGDRRGFIGGDLRVNQSPVRRKSEVDVTKAALFSTLPQIATRTGRKPQLMHQRSISDLGKFSTGDFPRRSHIPSSPSSNGSRSNLTNFSPDSTRSKVLGKSSSQLSFDASPVGVKRSKSDFMSGVSPSQVSRRSLTPPGRFYSGRYEASPTRPPNPGDRVKAIITAPAPKISPPLRSSRPRQHVSSARSASPLAPRGSDRSENGISPKVSATFGPGPEVSLQTPEKENLLTQLSNAVYQRPTPPPKLSIDVQDFREPANDEPTTAATEFEEDISLPTDDMPGSFPVQDDDEYSLSEPMVIPEDTQQLVGDRETEPGQMEVDPTEHTDTPGTVLNKIMELRQRSSVLLSGVLGSLPSSPQRGPTSPIRGSSSPRGTTSPKSGNATPVSGAVSPVRGSMTPIRMAMSTKTDPPLHASIASIGDQTDTSTIPIMLSDVPTGHSRHRNWQTREKLQRSKTQDSFVTASKGLTPVRGNVTTLSPSTGSHSKTNVSRSTSRYTLDSDSYSVINRVLDQYHESGVVSQDMVHSFQQHILETDPELACRSDIDSLSIARVALEDLIRDHSHSNLFGTRKRSPSSLIRNYSDSDVFGTGVTSHGPQSSAPNDSHRPSPVRKITSEALHNLEVEPDFGEVVPLSNASQNRQPPNATPTYRSRHYSIADQLVPGAETQNQPQVDSRQIPDDDIGPTPPPKDPKYPTSSRVERNYVSEGQPHNDRGQRQRQDPSSNPVKRPLLPEIPSTGGGLGLLDTPRALQESTSVPKSTNFVYSSTTSYNVGSSAQLGTPAPVLQPRRPSFTVSTPTSDSMKTISRQTTSEAVRTGRSTPIALGVQTLPTQVYEPPVQPGVVERPSSPVSNETPPTPEQRRLTKRRHLIKELVDTEFSFNQDMKVIEDIYKGTASAVEALTPDDRRILFGNSAQIVEFSESFLDTLKQASSSVYVMPRTNKWRIKRGSFTSTPNAEDASVGTPDANDEERDRKTYIGEAFGQHMAKMEKVYGDYLRNHDLANQRLSRLQNIPQVHLWLNECHTYASDITSAWDLDSLLVKPVQRILKYPLLLKSLLEETHTDYPDYPALEIAVKQMMDVSYRINESKKRIELLDQVVSRPAKKKDYDVSNALSKAFGRRTDKLKQQVGLSDAVEDPEYKAISEKFGGQFFQLQVVMRDMEMYKKTTEDFIKQYNRYIEAIEEMVDVGHNNSPEMEAKWRRLALTIREMTAIAYMDHEAAVRKHCIEPMVTLLRMHEGPQKLMQKRKKRIVEYAKYLTMKNRGERLDKKTQEQGEQFIALNETLKDELPKLFSLTAKLVQACLRNYVDIQAQWHATWQRKIKAMLKEQQIPKDISEIVEAFHTDFAYTEAQVLSLSICNGTLMSDASFLASSASTILGTDDSSSTKKRPSVLTQTNSVTSIPTAENSSQSPVLPQPDFVSKRRSNGSNTFAMPMSFNSPRASLETHRLSYHSSSNVPVSSNGASSPVRPNRLRTVSSASVKQPFNATPPIPPARNSSSSTVSYGPYNPTASVARPPSSTRPPTSSNNRNVAPPGNSRLSASSSKSAAPSAAALARTSSSTLYSAAGMGSGGVPPSSYPWSNQTSPNLSTGRYSGVFNSALPVGDSPPVTPGTATTPTGMGISMAGRISNVVDSPTVPTLADPGYTAAVASFEYDVDREQRPREASRVVQIQPGQREYHVVGGREHRILFLAASLFEFNIDRSRKEAGFPYLTYVPGEIFDVIAEKGELWLAKNQDDPGGLVGWIWEKHFAKLMPDGS